MEDATPEEIEALREAGAEIGEDCVVLKITGEEAERLVDASLKANLGIDIHDDDSVAQGLASSALILSEQAVTMALHLGQLNRILGNPDKPGWGEWLDRKEIRSAGIHMLLAAKRLTRAVQAKDTEDAQARENSLQVLNDIIRNF